MITPAWRERADYEFRLRISTFAEQIAASAVNAARWVPAVS
jgi:hypothetical protein